MSNDNFNEDVIPVPTKSSSIGTHDEKDDIDAAIDKVDINKDGKFGRNEVRLVVMEMIEKRNQAQYLKTTLAVALVLLLLSITGNIGATYLAVNLAKDTKIGDNNVLTSTSGGEIVQTGSYEPDANMTIPEDVDEDEVGNEFLNTTLIDNSRRLQTSSSCEIANKFIGCFRRQSAPMKQLANGKPVSFDWKGSRYRIQNTIRHRCKAKHAPHYWLFSTINDGSISGHSDYYHPLGAYIAFAGPNSPTDTLANRFIDVCGKDGPGATPVFSIYRKNSLNTECTPIEKKDLLRLAFCA